LVTGYGNCWTRERVTSLRSYHGIVVYKTADDGIEPWLNLNNAARLLQVAPKTLRVAAEAGKIKALHPFVGWSLDLQPCRSLHSAGACHHRTRTREPKPPPRDRIPISKACSLQ
jgi:hypothetical protein